MKNWWLKTKLGGWLFLTYHKLNARWIGISNGYHGLCPGCGTDHHTAEREEMYRKVNLLRGTLPFSYFQQEVKEQFAKNPNWRLGQTAFNVLYEQRPDISEQIRATDIDPFYNDSRLPKFFEKVADLWEKRND